jgi:hypothetical protein
MSVNAKAKAWAGFSRRRFTGVKCIALSELPGEVVDTIKKTGGKYGLEVVGGTDVVERS